MPTAAGVRAHDATSDADSIIVLHGVSWDDYKHLLRMRGDNSAPRISYLEGEVEIMSPSKDHEDIKSLIGGLVEAWCLDRDIEIQPLGSWTLEGAEEDRAVEADECYVFGTEDRDRPHLAIEVQWTRGGINKLKAYERLGVEEVWYWRKGRIQVYVLDGGRLAEAPRSRLLPDLDLELLASVLDRPTLTQAVRDFRKALAER